MPQPYNTYLRETLQTLLREKELERWLAFEESSLPLKPRPVFPETSEACDTVVFNGFCVQNLATYLSRYKGRRIGVLVKGCDRRAIAVLVEEKQLAREDLFLLGVPCPGMLNRTQLLTEFPGLDADQIAEEGGHLSLKISGETRTLQREDYLLPACRVCHHRTPEDVDALLDPPPLDAPETEESFATIVSSVGEMPQNDRAALFASEFSRCILCYACRNVCPLCYCDTCFTDSLTPAWMTASPEPGNIFFYHVNRMMHMAGRCVACGSCEWACPEHIQLHLLFGKITADVRDLFAYEAGIDKDAPQPLSHFSEDDPDEQIG